MTWRLTFIFCLYKSKEGTAVGPRLVIVRRGPEIGVFSQHGADGDSMCAVQIDKSF